MSEDIADLIEPGVSTSPSSTQTEAARSDGETPDLSKLWSVVYKAYTWDDTIKKFKCKKCPKTYPYHKGCGTSNLSKHLKQSHQSVITSLKSLPPARNGDIRNYTNGEDDRPAPRTFTADGAKQHLINFMVNTSQPFSLVDDDSFREYITYVSRDDSKFVPPKHTCMKNWISHKFQEEKTRMKAELLNNSSKVSFVLDGWTSSNQVSFLGVIASWVDDSWTLRTQVLDFKILDGTHSGENLAFAFGEILTEWELWPKLMAITTDNASNMDTMATTLQVMAFNRSSDFKAADHRVRCLAHIINLACQAILQYANIDDVEDTSNLKDSELRLVQKVRKAIVALRSSPQRLNSFKIQCEKMKVKHRMPIRDVRTCWNSTLDMLLRMKEIKPAIDATINGIPDIRHYKLTDKEWKQIDLLISFLEPFKEATLILSQDTSPSLSGTAGVYDFLFDHLEGFINKPVELAETPSCSKKKKTAESLEQDALAEAAKMAWQKLKEYYPYADGTIYVAATVLDPRLKLQWYDALSWHSYWQQNAKQLVEDMWEGYKDSSSQDLQVHATSRSKSTISRRGNSFENRMREKMKPFYKADDELRRYLTEPVVNPDLLGDGGVLGWWKIHHSEYPNLAKMARDVLSAQGTGVSVERLFSTGPDLLSPRRRSLLGNTIRECLCLKQWLRRDSVIDTEPLIVYKAMGEDYESSESESDDDDVIS